ncbi:DUF1302 family protein [Sulfurimonas sp.]|uniref:DUF1302 family protein n=1 Tax=Sulfurimonas sp. TaxID=2022749 RepID=UPI00262F4124|nr:DUF1302 family protein [Sulfurimonas sp.]MCW8895130.1 DUF1302 domain-containing protein [Sulfurimonas sp.]MCW9068104.1 DUF1302 domain-containing protein [Sulfurimonas sp.]
MAKKSLVSFYIIAVILSANIFANESIEDDLGGFGQEIITKEVLPIQKEENDFILSGDLAFKTSVGYKKHSVDGIEYSGINQAQTSLYLQLDGKLSDNWKVRISANVFYDAIYDMYSHNDYSKDIKDDYKTQLRLDDTYIQGKITSNIDVKIGRQIVIWGKSDTIRVTDVINPLDNRLPGMTDIEDLRLSVTMAKLDYYSGDWNFSFMSIFENRIMHEAPPRSEFFPVDSMFAVAPDPFLNLETPSNSFDNMQYAFAANGTFSGWDLSFYAAHVLDQKWHFDHVQGSVALTDTTRIVNKVDMLGSAVNIADGSWLYKAEAVYLSGVGYNTTADKKNRLDFLVGFDYSGFRDTVISLEVANRHIFEYEAQMKNQADYVDKDEMQTAIRLTRSFENETINANALISMFGSEWENGGFARVWVDYELAEALSLNLGIVDYIGGDKVFMDAIKDNDRVFADITYSF